MAGLENFFLYFIGTLNLSDIYVNPLRIKKQNSINLDKKYPNFHHQNQFFEFQTINN